ncbi:MAG: hypothetical protein AAGC76_04035 [Luteibacter sp.]|nr:hypothetical protein [Luteibacter sp.]MDQ7995005.1 hypothetical protein [Luteibacter sp.]
MEFRTDLEPMRSAYPDVEAARREFGMIQQAAVRALDDLPDHRALVEQLCAEHRPRSPAPHAGHDDRIAERSRI